MRKKKEEEKTIKIQDKAESWFPHRNNNETGRRHPPCSAASTAARQGDIDSSSAVL